MQAPDTLNGVIQHISDNLATEIQKTFDFFKATTSEDHIDAVYIAGGASKAPGLRGLLSDRLETSVEALNPFNNIIVQHQGVRPRASQRPGAFGRDSGGPGSA